MIKQGTEFDKAKYFLNEVRHLSDNDFMDSGVIDATAELIVAYNEFNTHKFTPERTAREEAEEIIESLVDIGLWYHDAQPAAIKSITNTITALKAANVSTAYHEEVLTILKGM